MKKLLFFAFAGVFILSSAAFASTNNPLLNGIKKSSSERNDENFLPGKIKTSYWNNGSWQLMNEELLKYNSAGLDTSSIMLDGSGNNMNRNVRSYNSLGLLSQDLNYTWTSTAWEPLGRNTYLYDQYGNQTSYISESWNSTNQTWVMNYGNRSTFTYSGSKIATKTSEFYDASSSAWVYSSKTIYTYNSSQQVLTETHQSYDNGTWVTDEVYTITYGSDGKATVLHINSTSGSMTYEVKYENLVWHTWDGNFETSVIQTYTGYMKQGGFWIPVERATYTFGANDSYEAIFEQYQGSWSNSTKEVYQVDSHGNETLSENYSYNNGWVLDNGSRTTHTYSTAGALTLSVIENYSNATMQYETSQKLEYFDFFDVTSVVELKNNDVIIYPNPGVGQFNLKLDEQSFVTVYDVAMKKVFEASFNAGVSEIELNVLQGTYVLVSRSASGKTSSSKLVITE